MGFSAPESSNGDATSGEIDVQASDRRVLAGPGWVVVWKLHRSISRHPSNAIHPLPRPLSRSCAVAVPPGTGGRLQ